MWDGKMGRYKEGGKDGDVACDCQTVDLVLLVSEFRAKAT